MKKLTAFCLALVLLTMSACGLLRKPEPSYTPQGEFYVKTSPARGDAGVDYVISLEAEEKRQYTGGHNLFVSMTVGLGHLPGSSGYRPEHSDSFYVHYEVYEFVPQGEDRLVWEYQQAYTDSWYDPKYDSTQQVNRPFLMCPHYGEFYPQYHEAVPLFFPAGVDSVYVQVSIHIVKDGEVTESFGYLTFSFRRDGDYLLLEA